MRIIGGSLRGRVLLEFSKIGVRPTSDRARESLFNILQTRIIGSSFLDLFSGTGAVGIEAYSRGASKVALNDNSKDSLNLIKKNLEKTNILNKVKLLNSDGVALLKSTAEKYDIVFIDPPYQCGLEKDILENILNALNENGVAVYETETPFNENKVKEYNNKLKIVDIRKYGRAYLTFFTKGE